MSKTTEKSEYRKRKNAVKEQQRVYQIDRDVGRESQRGEATMRKVALAASAIHVFSWIPDRELFITFWLDHDAKKRSKCQFWTKRASDGWVLQPHWPKDSKSGSSSLMAWTESLRPTPQNSVTHLSKIPVPAWRLGNYIAPLNQLYRRPL